MIERLIRFSLGNRLLLVALSLLVMAGGIHAYRQLPVDAFPDVSPNLVQVFTVTEGLAPEEIEKYVTYPVEVAMNGLPGVKQLRSVSNFGLSVVNVYFKDAMDIYFARQLVAERLQEAREQIPEGFGEPEMGPIATGMGLILFYYLDDTTGQYSLEELRTMQDWVVKLHLQTTLGVTEVLGIGGYEKQFQVRVRAGDLLRYDLTVAEVVEKIEANSLNVGAQFIEKNAEEFVVRSVGLATGIADLESIVLRTVHGVPIYLRQVADVAIGGAVRRGVQTRNGVGEVVAGMVVKLIGANASTVIDRIEHKIDEINAALPEGVHIVPYYEQKTLVEACVTTVRNALVQGVLLVILVLSLFMGGIRPSLVVALSIPFSILFAALGMRYFGVSANLMSLGGLAIAIGMLVDGTIVVVENVEEHLRRGQGSLVERVRAASLEVGRPIAFAIAIIIVVFLPLFTLEGVEGKTFRPLAFSVALAMLGSLIFAVVLAPMLSSLLLRGGHPGFQTGKGLGERLIHALERAYAPVLEVFVRRPKRAVVLSLILVGIGIGVFPLLGSEFTPKLREGTIVVRLTMAPSIALTESTRLAQIVERRLMKIPEVMGVTTRVGRGEVGAHADPVNSAEMYVGLAPKDEWRNATTQEDLEELIREELGELPGILVNLTQPIEMSVDELLEGVRGELAIKLFGDDLQVLKRKADEIAATLGTVRGASDVQADQVSGAPQLLLKVDREAIARYGVNVADVQEVIHAAVGGETVGQIFEGTRRFDILVRLEESARNTRETISNILVPGPEDLRVPLAELASIEEIVGPRQITRQDGQRFITVQANVTGRDIGTFVEDAKRVIATGVTLPPGYLLTWGGQFRLQQEANKRFAVVIPLTLLLLFLFLYANFQSLGSATLILLNIPLALVGGVVALALAGENLSVPASVGFIALFGIALENGMVLVSYLNQLVDEGISIADASKQAAVRRLRPVLMTALTTALGLFPLLFSTGTGSEVQRPLATVVVGGLVTSTVLTLLVLPAAYRWFSAKKPDPDRLGSRS